MEDVNFFYLLMGVFGSLVRFVRTVVFKIPLAIFSGNGQQYQQYLMVAYGIFMLFFLYNIIWAVLSPAGGLMFYVWKGMYMVYYHDRNMFYDFGPLAKLSLLGRSFSMLDDWGNPRKSMNRKFPLPLWMSQEELVLVRECTSYEDCNHSLSEILISFKCKKTDDREVSIPVTKIEHVKLDDRHWVFFYTFNPVEIGNRKLDACSRDNHDYVASMYHSSFPMLFDIFSHPTLPGIKKDDAVATFSKLDDSINVGVVADNQYQFYRFQTILEHLSLQMKKNKLDLILHLGDAVQEPKNLQQWQTDFFDPIRTTGLFSLPWILVHGNHDYVKGQKPLYKPENSYYTLKLPFSTHLIILDSNLDDSQDQLDWFNEIIESDDFKSARYRIVSIHIPPYIEYWDREAWEKKGESRWNQKIRETYAPLFERHGVNLVLSGHQHNYQRGSRNQVLYVICGGAGGNLDQEMVVNYGFNEKTIVNHHYLILNIAEKALTGKVYNFNNRKVDEWKIKPNL